MVDRTKRLIKPIIATAAVLFLLCAAIKKPSYFSDIISCLSYSISGTALLFVLYERWIWKYIPWNRPYVFKNSYTGTIKYEYNNVPGKKNIEVAVKQTWGSISVRVTTDINESKSITAQIVNEHQSDVLYYTYITNPSASSQDSNPIQHGTCRIELTKREDNSLRGKYWTSRRTTGDIYWTEKD